MSFESNDRLRESNLGARLLTRIEAARYCGISVSAFSKWVSLGRIPSVLPGTSRWDLRAIHIALDSLSSLEPTETSALDYRPALQRAHLPAPVRRDPHAGDPRQQRARPAAMPVAVLHQRAHRRGRLQARSVS